MTRSMGRGQGGGAGVGRGRNKAKTDSEYTALHLAAWNGHAEVVEDLVGVAADCDAVDSEGWTPLHYAAWNGHEAAMRALECSGADVDAADNAGKQPLHPAAEYDKCEASSELLESGAAIIILREWYPHDLRETLQMAGAEAV